jgi:hypothetical protein
MISTNGKLGAVSSAPQRDRSNQRRVTFWSLAWAGSYIAVTLSIRMGWLGAGPAVAAVMGTALFGTTTLWAYRRFLMETDELRRKIEVEALAFAFGIGIIGGLTFFLLFENGFVSGSVFAYLFVAMILAHAAGVAVGRRRYS